MSLISLPEKWISTSIYPVRNLKPEKTRSWEVGVNSKWLNNRLSFDLTYYRSSTINQTFTADLSVSSGYSKAYIQSGNVRNEGMEIALGYSDKWGGFSWDSNLTFSWNQNKIIKLTEGSVNPMTGEPITKDNYEMGQLGNLDARVKLYKGGSIGDVYATHRIKRDGNNNIYVSQEGKIEIESVEEFKLGSILPKSNMGWSNNILIQSVNLGSDTDCTIRRYCLVRHTEHARPVWSFASNRRLSRCRWYLHQLRICRHCKNISIQ